MNKWVLILVLAFAAALPTALYMIGEKAAKRDDDGCCGEPDCKAR